MDLDDIFSAKMLIPLFIVIVCLFYLSTIIAISMDVLPFLLIGGAGLVIGTRKGYKMLTNRWDRGVVSDFEYLGTPGGLEAIEQFERDVDAAQIAGALPSPRQGRLSSVMLAAYQRAMGASEQHIGPAARDHQGEHEDEILRLGRILETGDEFAPLVNHFLGAGILFSGLPGMGKSNAVARLAEQAGKCYLPLVIFDVKREYHTLVNVVPNGLRAGHPKLKQDVGPGFFALTPDTIQEFAAAVIENGFQAIVDLPSFGGDHDMMGATISEVMNALMDCADAQPSGERIPCLIILDEAQYFLPENQGLSQLSKDVFTELSKAFFRVVNMGRSYGFTMCLATQRLANVKKAAIATLQIKFFLRHMEKNDLDSLMKEITVIRRDELSGLPRGQAVAIAPDGDQFLVEWAERKSEHTSHTPEVERAHKRYRDGIKPAKASRQLPDDDLPSIADEDGDNEGEEQNTVIELGRDCSITREEYAIALRLRKSGMAKGYRDLMDPFKLTEHFAKELNKLILKDLGAAE